MLVIYVFLCGKVGRGYCTPTLTGKHLPFASSWRLITIWYSKVIFLQRTFTSLVHAHAGRIQGLPVDAVANASTPLKGMLGPMGKYQGVIL